MRATERHADTGVVDEGDATALKARDRSLHQAIVTRRSEGAQAIDHPRRRHTSALRERGRRRLPGKVEPPAGSLEGRCRSTSSSRRAWAE
jgi:hypothetical protein